MGLTPGGKSTHTPNILRGALSVGRNSGSSTTKSAKRGSKTSSEASLLTRLGSVLAFFGIADLTDAVTKLATVEATDLTVLGDSIADNSESSIDGASTISNENGARRCSFLSSFVSLFPSCSVSSLSVLSSFASPFSASSSLLTYSKFRSRPGTSSISARSVSGISSNATEQGIVLRS